MSTILLFEYNFHCSVFFSVIETEVNILDYFQISQNQSVSHTLALLDGESNLMFIAIIDTIVCYPGVNVIICLLNLESKIVAIIKLTG